MLANDIDATFGPVAGDRQTLPKAALATLDAIYRHPLAHNLEWADVVALFERLGSVEQKSNNEVAFTIGGEHRLVRKPHTKDLTTSEVMEFRHVLTQHGWSPHKGSAGPVGSAVASHPADTSDDVLVVMEHHQARLYHLDVRSRDPAEAVIRPYDPHHFIHHLAHKDQSRERGQRAPEDPGFYRRIAEAIARCGRVVVIGHGTGHSDAAHHLIEHLKLHCPETYKRVAREVTADLSSVTEPQLLILGRRALTATSPSGIAE